MSAAIVGNATNALELTPRFGGSCRREVKWHFLRLPNHDQPDRHVAATTLIVEVADDVADAHPRGFGARARFDRLDGHLVAGGGHEAKVERNELLFREAITRAGEIGRQRDLGSPTQRGLHVARDVRPPRSREPWP